MLFIDSNLYIDAITLVLNDENTNVKNLVNELISIYDEDKKISANVKNEVTQFCISVLKDISKFQISFDNKDELLSSLLKFKTNPTVIRDSSAYDLLEKIINRERRVRKEKLEEIKTKIYNSILWYHISKKSRNMLDLVNRCSITEDHDKQTDFFGAIKETAQSIINEFDTKNDIFFNGLDDANKSIERIDMSDKESIRRGLVQHKEKKGQGFKTGLQGLNRMFGKLGGPTLGESICFNALSHNFKSGMLLSMAKWFVHYNNPKPGPNGELPTILLISLENEANQNLMMLFKDAYELAYGESADGKDDQFIIDYVYDYFNQNGFKLVVERKLGVSFGYNEYVELHEMYERSGHNVMITIIDYMNIMKKENSNDKGMRPDLQLRNLYSNMCNYTKNKSTMLITAHQLNREAASIASSNKHNVVKLFDMCHLADGMDPQREVDFVAFMHIETNQYGEPYLTIQKRKHRYVHDTDKKHNYVAYKFNHFGIPDDVNGKDMSCKNIYAEDSALAKNNSASIIVDGLF